jgi:hypothetical protein
MLIRLKLTGVRDQLDNLLDEAARRICRCVRLLVDFAAQRSVDPKQIRDLVAARWVVTAIALVASLAKGQRTRGPRRRPISDYGRATPILRLEPGRRF